MSKKRLSFLVILTGNLCACIEQRAINMVKQGEQTSTELPAAERGELARAESELEMPDGSISFSKLAQAGAQIGDILKWNGSAWVPGSVAVVVNQTIVRPTSATGSAFVIKDGNQVAAWFLGFDTLNTDDDGQNGWVIYPGGEIVPMDFYSGKIRPFSGQIYFSDPNCQGTAYLHYRLHLGPNVKNKVVSSPTKGMFKISGYAVGDVEVRSLADHTTVGQQGVCINETKTLSRVLSSRPHPAILTPIPALPDLSHLAPLELQID